MLCFAKREEISLQRVGAEKSLVASGLALGVARAGGFPGQQTSTVAGWPCPCSLLSECRRASWWCFCFCCPGRRYQVGPVVTVGVPEAAVAILEFPVSSGAGHCFLALWSSTKLGLCRADSELCTVVTMLLVGLRGMPWQLGIAADAFPFAGAGSVPMICPPWSSSLPLEYGLCFPLWFLGQKTHRFCSTSTDL